MDYSMKTHGTAHLAKMLLGGLYRAVYGFPHRKGDLLVLNYHSTPKWLMPEFSRQLDVFSRYFELVGPDYFDVFYGFRSGEIPEKPALILAFDDGLRNNLYAAEELQKRGSRGVFLAVPAFFSEEENQMENYYRTHIRSAVNGQIDHQPEDLRAMRPAELRDLAAAGHEIGSHSWTHAIRAELSGVQLEKEIIESKTFIEGVTGKPVTHYCAPFNSLLSTAAHHMPLIRANYRYFQSSFPGSNAVRKNPLFIKRVNIESFWKMNAAIFACSHWEWKRWEKFCLQFESEVLGEK